MGKSCSMNLYTSTILSQSNCNKLTYHSAPKYGFNYEEYVFERQNQKKYRRIKQYNQTIYTTCSITMYFFFESIVLFQSN